MSCLDAFEENNDEDEEKTRGTNLADSNAVHATRFQQCSLGCVVPVPRLCLCLRMCLRHNLLLFFLLLLWCFLNF